MLGMHFQLLKSAGRKISARARHHPYAAFRPHMEDGRKEPVFDAYLAIITGCSLSCVPFSMVLPLIPRRAPFGSSDCSTNDDYLAGSKWPDLIPKLNWCFVSVLAEAYCLQVQKLQKLLAREKRKQPQAKGNGNGSARAGADAGARDIGNAVGNTSGSAGANSSEIEKLIAFGTGKGPSTLTALSPRITCEGAVKANGRECPAWAIPEAYELVSPIGPLSGSHAAALAGANTPLAWGQASLFRAASLFRQILSSPVGLELTPRVQ